MNTALTAVPGIKVGHADDPVGLTGCTVILCEGGAVGAYAAEVVAAAIIRAATTATDLGEHPAGYSVKQ